MVGVSRIVAFVRCGEDGWEEGGRGDFDVGEVDDGEGAEGEGMFRVGDWCDQIWV